MLVAFGFGIMMAGFVYDILYAGIPYQDPTPQLAAEYAVSQTVANTLFLAGASIASLGSLLAIWTAVRAVWQLMQAPRVGSNDAAEE